MLSMQQMESLLPGQMLGRAIEPVSLRPKDGGGGGGGASTSSNSGTITPAPSGTPRPTGAVIAVRPPVKPGLQPRPTGLSPVALTPKMPAIKPAPKAPLIKPTMPTQSSPIIAPRDQNMLIKPTMPATTVATAPSPAAQAAATATTPVTTSTPAPKPAAPATAPIITSTPLPSVQASAPAPKPTSSQHSMSTEVTPPAIETLLPEPSFVEESKPWYKNPFVWLGIGGAAVAVGGGAWYLTHRKSGGLHGARRRRRVR